MDASINFLFRDKLYCCEAFVDKTEFPCYVFVILRNQDLIEEFGGDVTLKTDFNSLLPRKDDAPSLLSLRNSIYNSLKGTLQFQQAKTSWQNNSLHSCTAQVF